MRIHVFLFLFLSYIVGFSQVKVYHEKDVRTAEDRQTKKKPLDSIRNLYGARYVDYKIVKYNLDTIQIDTTLTIQKHFRNNFTDKDLFEYAEWSNQGQVLQPLGYRFVNNNLLPTLGIEAKKVNYFGVENIDYYHVPTPTTILNYRSGFEGQVLNSIFTMNFSKHLNFSIAYKGMRSTGNYQSQQTRHSNFRTTLGYYNPKKRYQFRTHIASQNLINQENGGLTDASIVEFRANNPDFATRARIDVNLFNSKSALKSNRFYFEHAFRLRKESDSIQNNLTIGHKFYHETEKYLFDSTDADFFDSNTIYGERFNSQIGDRTKFTTFKNHLYTQFTSPYILGDFNVFYNYYNTQQTYKSVVFLNGNTIPSSRENNFNSLGASWQASIKGVFLNAFAEQILTGERLGTNFNVEAGYQLNEKLKLTGGVQIKDEPVKANVNFFQSGFENFNWSNNFDNITYKNIYGTLKTPWFNARLDLNQIDNFIYFNSISQPTQFDGTVNYAKVQFQNEFKWKKFTLNNRIQWQDVVSGAHILRVPSFITRNTLYYADDFFKGKPMYAQIGLEFKYFSEYFANEFNPVLNEYYIQNHTKIGAYPTLNGFINARVRRTRVYIKFENIINTLGSTTNHFITPSQPARDFAIRLGVIWNFFN